MNIEDLKLYLCMAYPYLLIGAIACALIPMVRRSIVRRYEALLNLIIEPGDISPEIITTLQLSPQEVVLAVKLPLKQRKIQGQQTISNLMLISKACVYFLRYIQGRGIQESAQLLFNNIIFIEAKTKEVWGLGKRPYISISTTDNTRLPIYFPSNKTGSENIKRILEAFRKVNRDLKIIGEAPQDFRSERIKKIHESTKDVRQQIDGDLNDLFK